MRKLNIRSHIRRAMAATVAGILAVSLSVNVIAAGITCPICGIPDCSCCTTSLGSSRRAVSFSDVNSTSMPGYEAILYCASQGIISGYSDGTFRPTNTLSRGAFTAVLSRAFFPDTVAQYDIPTYQKYGTFYPNCVAMMMENALIGVSFEDYPKANLNLGVSRYDMAQLVTNIMNRKGYAASSSEKNAAIPSITDYSSIPSQYKDAVANVYSLGIIGGYSGGYFSGDSTVTRQVGAIVMYRMLAKCDMLDNEVGTPDPEAPIDPGTGESACACIKLSGECKCSNTTSTGSGTGSGNTSNPTTPTTPNTGRTLANGKAITEANVTEILNQLKAAYPRKTDFSKGYAGLGSGRNPSSNCISQITNTYWRAEDHSTKTSTTSGCGGWAAFVADEIFGQTGVTWKKTTLVNARPGDLLVIVDGQGYLTHVAICAGESTDGLPKTQELYLTEAGSSGGYKIYWANGMYPNTIIYTAYPD